MEDKQENDEKYVFDEMSVVKLKLTKCVDKVRNVDQQIEFHRGKHDQVYSTEKYMANIDDDTRNVSFDTFCLHIYF